MQGPQTARRERQAGSSSPRKQSLLSQETHKADGYAQGVCLGLCCAIGSTSHMWLFKTIKIKDDEKFSSLVPLGPPPGLGSHTRPVATESDGENTERAHGRGKFCWASRKPTGMRKWLGARESHGALGRDKELGDRSCLHLATSRVPGPPGEPAPPFSWGPYAPRPASCWEHFAGRVGEASRGGRPESIASSIAHLPLIGLMNRGTNRIWRSDRVSCCFSAAPRPQVTNHPRPTEAEEPG